MKTIASLAASVRTVLNWSAPVAPSTNPDTRPIHLVAENFDNPQDSTARRTMTWQNLDNTFGVILTQTIWTEKHFKIADAYQGHFDLEINGEPAQVIQAYCKVDKTGVPHLDTLVTDHGTLRVFPLTGSLKDATWQDTPLMLVLDQDMLTGVVGPN